MKQLQYVIVVSLVALAIPASAQYAPVAGAEDFTDLYSPRMLAEGSPLMLGDGPQTDALNPATSALVQRTTIDASYIGLTGFGSRADQTGWQGHVVNLGLVSPTRAGVFSGSFHVIASNLAGMPLGTSGWMHASAAKELYPGWLVGAGVRVGAGSEPDPGTGFDIGAALDLGLIRTVGDLGSFTDFRWGASFQNIGKWYDPFSANGQMPSAFTPGGGVSFVAFSNDWLELETAGGVTVPGFRNVRLGVSGVVTLFDRVAIHLGWKADLRQLLDPGIDRRSLIPSFGLSGVFRSGLGDEGFAADRGWTETEIRTQTGAAALYNGVWAFGAGVNAPLGIIDEQGPVIEVDYWETAIVSPNNDGFLDALNVPITITDDRFIVGWAFEISGATGELVRTIRNKEERPENEGFQSIVDRLLDVRTGIQIPEAVRWNGTADTGETVSDGQYSFRVRAIDDNGNVGESPEFDIIVDRTAPELKLQAMADEERVFSPNADGNKDTLRIVQSGSTEELWSAEVVNARGAAVRTFTWENGGPSTLAWDGRNDNGEAVPDGVYRYRIESTDRGGNSVSGEIANIILNTESTPASLLVNSSFISPNGDGSLDELELTPEVPNNTGIVRWEILILDTGSDVVREFSGDQVVPSRIIFDGLASDGTVLDEGVYEAKLLLEYRNGNRPEATSPPFTVDVTPPTVAVQAERTLFSPNGDGNLDTVTLFQETSREQRWYGRVTTRSGAIIRETVWTTLADQRVVWNGRQDDGRLAVDGTYFYTLESTDRAGNSASSEPIEVVIDTSDAEIGVRAEFDAFSPNADGVRDRQQLLLRVDRADDIRSYVVTVIDAAGSPMRTFEGRTVLQPSVVWDGTTSDGRRVPDGTYRATIDVTFLNGVEIEARTAEFTVDTARPSITVTTPYRVFSPDGDGERESVRIVQTSTAEERWVASIFGPEGSTVREYVWTGRVGPVDWDGRDSAGNLVPDGVYSYQVSATDRAGNATSGGVEGLTVDNRQPRLFVTSSDSAFSPNGDGIRDNLSFDLYANLLDGATGWRLTILSADGLAVREFRGTEVSETQSISWDGRDGRGRLREGEFVAQYAVEYEKGNRPVVQSGPVVLDVSAPSVNLDFEPLPFSPDNDGVDDELRIGIDVSDVSEIQGWRLEILDRNNRFFTEFSGRGAPAPLLIWDGRAVDGELVISAEDYPYVLTMRDELGNETVERGMIPVDILVIRDGDRLKVQISNITFAPNSPELIIDVSDERGAKNRAILLRLAEIFDKYSSYSIRIEGHAVNVTGTEREEREELQPLSLARAQSVKDAMVELGISERRVSVLGRGGTEPIVPHDDMDNRWKNRRVEFVLIR